MLARLGLVLYGLAIIVALLLVALAVAGLLFGDKADRLLLSGLLFGVAIVAWVIGRVLFYVLSGE